MSVSSCTVIWGLRRFQTPVSLLDADGDFVLQFDAILVDYLHKRKFPIIGPFAKWTLRAATLGVLFGVYQFNTNDIGMSRFRSETCTSLPFCGESF